MENQKISLLFLTTEFPYPADSGGRIKSYRLVQYLAQHYDVKLLCAYGSRKPELIEQFKAEAPVSNLQIFGQHRSRTPLNFLNALMTAPSFNAFRIYSKELEAMVKWSAESCDIVMIDHLETIDLIPEDFKGKIIYHSHNAEFKLWKSFAQVRGSLLTQWLLNWEASRVRLLERYAIRRCHFTFAAPNDIEAMKEEFQLPADKFRITYHLGKDYLLELPAPVLASNPKQVFYAGTLSWEPNRDGLQWFLQSCWPKVIQDEPDAELIICGSGADDSLKSIMRQTPGVSYKGFVDSLESHLASSRCAIVPLRMGSGMKIKTFDAMYRGVPVVSTEIGIEGIDVKNKEHVLVHDDAEGFANAVSQCLSSTTESTLMRDAARKLVTERYTYKSLLASMQKDLDEILK